MPNNTKIISVLTFCFLTLHPQLHANEITKDPSHSNNKEFYIFNSDQSNVNYASLAANNSGVKQYGEIYPDYNAETLEDFLQEHSGIAVAGTDFYRFPEENSLYRKGRCPLRTRQNYIDINANKKRKGKVKLIKQYLSSIINKTTAAPIFIDDGSSDHYKTTLNILFPTNNVPKKTSYHLTNVIPEPNSLAFMSKCKFYDKRSSIDKTNVKYNIESDFSSKYYVTHNPKLPFLNNDLLRTDYFHLQTQSCEISKPNYVQNEETTQLSRGAEKDRLPTEIYLFSKSPPKVLGNPVHLNDHLQQTFGNQSSTISSATSLNPALAINRKSPQIIKSLQNSSMSNQVKEENIYRPNNNEWQTVKYILESDLNKIKDSLRPTDGDNAILSGDSNSKIGTESGSFVLANDPSINASQRNVRNQTATFTEAKEKRHSKDEGENFKHENNFTPLNENDYWKTYRNLSKNLKEVGKNKFMRHHTWDMGRNFNISNNNERNSSLLKANGFKLEKTELEKSNFDENTRYKNNDIAQANYVTHDFFFEPLHAVTESVRKKTESNEKLFKECLNKRQSYQRYHGYASTNLPRKLYDDYDYYFMIGDSNTDEPPLVNGYNAIGVRTEKTLREKDYWNDETNFQEAEKSKKIHTLTAHKRNQCFDRKKTNLITSHTDQNVATKSPNVIHKSRFWPNIGKREMFRLKDSKNYIINLFRRRGNYFRDSGMTSSTTVQTQLRNILFQKRNTSSIDDSRRFNENGFLEDLAADSKISIMKNYSNDVTSKSSSPIKALSLPPDSSYKNHEIVRDLNKNVSYVKPAAEHLNNQKVIQNSAPESKEETYNKINVTHEKSQSLERKKRKSAMMSNFCFKRGLPKRLMRHCKHPRRSIFDNGNPDDYNIKFQNLQKDLLELQRAIASPKASHTIKNEDKNLTLQIRVIVDVVNNSLVTTEEPEEEPLKKRDTKIAEKKCNSMKGDTVPMPLEHDSPLEDEKKGTDVWRNKRVDNTVNELQKKKSLIAGKENISNTDLSEHVIRSITYLLDNLLENYKLQNMNGKQKYFSSSVIKNLQNSTDQKFKRSFIEQRKPPSFIFTTIKPLMIGNYNIAQLLDKLKTAMAVSATDMGLLSALANKKICEKAILHNLYNKEHNDSKIQSLQDLTTQNNNKTWPNAMLNLLTIRNRRSANGRQSLRKLMTDYKKKLFQNEVNALSNIVERIKKKLIFYKMLDYIENIDHLSNEVNIFESVGRNAESQKVTSNNDKKKVGIMKDWIYTGYAKFIDVLETIRNIEKELEQVKPFIKEQLQNPIKKYKNDLLTEILGPELENSEEEYIHRNKSKINRRKDYIPIISPTSNKVGYLDKFKNHAKPITNILEKRELKESKFARRLFSKTTIQPILDADLEGSTLSKGENLTIEWCCPNEPGKNRLFEMSHIPEDVDLFNYRATLTTETTESTMGEATSKLSSTTATTKTKKHHHKSTKGFHRHTHLHSSLHTSLHTTLSSSTTRSTTELPTHISISKEPENYKFLEFSSVTSDELGRLENTNLFHTETTKYNTAITNSESIMEKTTEHSPSTMWETTEQSPSATLETTKQLSNIMQETFMQLSLYTPPSIEITTEHMSTESSHEPTGQLSTTVQDTITPLFLHTPPSIEITTEHMSTESSHELTGQLSSTVQDTITPLSLHTPSSIEITTEHMSTESSHVPTGQLSTTVQDTIAQLSLYTPSFIEITTELRSTESSHEPTSLDLSSTNNFEGSTRSTTEIPTEIGIVFSSTDF